MLKMASTTRSYASRLHAGTPISNLIANAPALTRPQGDCTTYMRSWATHSENNCRARGSLLVWEGTQQVGELLIANCGRQQFAAQHLARRRPVSRVSRSQPPYQPRHLHPSRTSQGNRPSQSAAALIDSYACREGSNGKAVQLGDVSTPRLTDNMTYSCNSSALSPTTRHTQSCC